MSFATVEDTFQVIPYLPRGNLVEFGVYSGNTLNRLINGAAGWDKPFDKVYGFDSFLGLPEEAPHVKHNHEWPKGAFSISQDKGLATVEDAITYVRGNIERKDIELIPGFFETSLTKELGKTLEYSASYLHIDVDIYLSTIQVLEWIVNNNIAKIGSLVRFDDWWWQHNEDIQEWTASNSLAMKEITEKYNLKWQRLSSNVFLYGGRL